MTLAEIAEAAGVSSGTVDRVIHKRSGVAPKTKEKIEAIIAQHGYHPNPMASQLKKKNKLLIGVLLPELNFGQEYWNQLYSGILKAVSLLSPFDIELIRHPFNRHIPGDALEKAEEIIQKGISGLITAPVNPEEFITFLEDIDSIPYIFVDTPFTPGNPFLSIVQNPYQGGSCAGRIMKQLKGSGTYVCFRMFLNAYNLRERCRGFKDYITQDSGSNVIEAICPDLSDRGIFEFMDELLILHPQVKGIFVPHAEGYIISQYLIEKGVKEKIALVCYDLILENKNRLQEGSIDCIIGQRPEFQGLNAAYALHSYLNLHQKVSGKLNVPIDIFYSENIVTGSADFSLDGIFQ